MKSIFIGLAPNLEFNDAWLAFSLFVRPWKWRKGVAVKHLEDSFKKITSTQNAIAFTSGRGCLTALLKAYNISEGDEVLVQAFTCVAVPNPVLHVGAKPVYVDIDEHTLNMSVEDLKKKITSKSKVLIIQHTFGYPADIDTLMKVACEHNLIVIEDCAHALGAEYKGQKVGTFGNAGFFSFGRDKVISSVYGGIVVTSDNPIAEKVKKIQDNSEDTNRTWIVQQLWYQIIMYKSKLLFDLFIGRGIFLLARKFNIITTAVWSGEYRGKMLPVIINRMPNALAIMAIFQLNKLERFNSHREQIVKTYRQKLGDMYQTQNILPDTNPVHLRYTLQSDRKSEILKRAKRNKIYLGDWYDCPVAPIGVDEQAICYNKKDCPVAERMSKTSFNLPTNIHISKNDVQRIINVLI